MTIESSRIELHVFRQQDQSVRQYSGLQKAGKRGRSKTAWQDTLRDDLLAMAVSWEEAKSVAGDGKEWREAESS